MTSDIWVFLSFLEKVREVGKGKWVSLCPAHDDHSPSLTIGEGERGFLLRCWAGCSLDEICVALGIRKCELFYDHGMPPSERRSLPPRLRRFNWRGMSHDLEFASESHWLRSQAIFESTRKIDLRTLNDEELDATWKCLAVGFHSLQVSENLKSTAFKLRAHGLKLSHNRLASRVTARRKGRAAA